MSTPLGGSNFSDGGVKNGGKYDHYFTNDDGNYIFVRGTFANLPSGVAGYAVGCEYTAGDTGTKYTNIGTTSSCNFTAISTGTSFFATISALGTAQNSTPTTAQLLTGIVTQGSTGATGTVTLPLGATISAGIPQAQVGTSFETIFANLGGGQALTITGATGTTVIGSANVSSATNAILDFVNTGTGLWDVFVK